MTPILTINTIVFLLLFAIWTKKDWFNAIVKTLFLGLGLANGFLLARALGFIVKG